MMACCALRRKLDVIRFFTYATFGIDESVFELCTTCVKVRRLLHQRNVIVTGRANLSIRANREASARQNSFRLQRKMLKAAIVIERRHLA